MTGTRDLESRIRALEDIEAIKRLKYRYFRLVDTQRFEALREVFTPDATTSYQDELSQQGIDAIIEFLRTSLGTAIKNGRMGMHLGHHPEIELTSETTATGVWALDDNSMDANTHTARWMGAYYQDRYVKVNGQWKIKHTGYIFLFHGRWEEPTLTAKRGQAAVKPPG